MSEPTTENRAKPTEPFEGIYRSTLDRLASNLHQTVAAVGLNTPIEEFIDDKSRLVIRVDMPGMDPDDIEAKVRSGRLIIEGRRRHRNNGPRENVLRSEIMYGRLRRSLALPSWVENGEVELGYADGVLELRLATNAETCPHTSVFKPKRTMRASRSETGASKKAESSGRPAVSA